jgi:hypothetical protein
LLSSYIVSLADNLLTCSQPSHFSGDVQHTAAHEKREGAAEGLRRVCDRGTDKPRTHEEHCLVAVLYERLEDKAATLSELEKTLRARRKGEGARTASPCERQARA